MRRNTKSMVILVMILIAACILTGCGKDDTTTAVNQTDAEATIGVAPTNVPTEKPTAEPTKVPAPSPTIEPTDTPTHKPEVEETVSSADVTEQATEEPAMELEKNTSSEPSQGMFDPWFSVETSIAYSSGTDSDWSYGNQRKEFSVEKPCYVRIGSSVVADWHWGWRYGEGNAITITYRFTGAMNSQIEVSDGFVTSIPSDDPDVLIFTRTLTAKSEHEEDVIVFRYEPIQEGSVSLEVIYDDQVKSQYDERNTVYFIVEEW